MTWHTGNRGARCAAVARLVDAAGRQCGEGRRPRSGSPNVGIALWEIACETSTSGPILHALA